MCLCIYKVTIKMSIYIYIYIYIYERALPVHVCTGHVCSLLSIMTALLCVLIYEALHCVCITCVGHVSQSMCILLDIKSSMLCNKNFCGMLCTMYSCKLKNI